MDNPSRPKQGSASLGYCAPATNICTQTTDEQQTSLQEFENIVKVQTIGQAAISTSGTSAEANEAISVTQHAYDNICISVHSQNCQNYSSLEPFYNIEMPGGSRNQPTLNHSVIVSSVHEHNRKRSEPNYRLRQEIEQDRKRCKSEICGKSGKHVSTCADTVATLDNSALISIDGQNIESNISISKTGQNVNAPRQISASAATQRGSIWSVDDILACPGQSEIHAIQNEPKVLDEKLKSSNASKIESVVPRRIFACMFCGEGIDKHTRIKYKEYCCCVCKYTTNKTNPLQKHIRIHCSKIECNVCSKEYTEGALHVFEQTCQFCNGTFRCRTQFDEHLLEDHEEYLGKNCWECYSPVTAHRTRKEGKKLFFCCVCGHETYKVKHMQNHNEVHRPKNFCKICKEEYTDEEKVFHNGKYLCINCKKEFKCRNQIEDHHQGDLSCLKHFSEHCRLCNDKITEHIEEEYYKCCDCHNKARFNCDFQIHLHTHTGLKIFKCGTCGVRYQQERKLNKHTKKCIQLPSVCEICKARFPEDEYLTKYCLEKHRQTT